MKKHLVLISGIALLAFTVLGYFGNFVQWSDAERTTATIVNAEQLRARRGAGNIKLDIQYSADGNILNGTVSVSPSTMNHIAPAEEIEVFYKRNDPSRVIPVAVLTEKQKFIYITLCAGILLTIAGVIISLRKRAANTPSHHATDFPARH